MTCSDEETVKEALREAELYRLFDHPNIIKILDSCIKPSDSTPGAREVYMILPFYRV